MIEVTSLSFSFGADPIFSNLSIRVARAEILSVLGPSGIGKTTLLRCIAGLLRSQSGSILIEGSPPQEATRAQKVGYLFQQDSLLEWRTVRENVQLPFEAAGQQHVAYDPRVTQSLQLVGLEHVGNKFPRHLSGGMRQRAALARALAPDPRILLLDEPFAAIDLLTRERIMIELYAILRKAATSTILVTHHIEEAIFLSDRLILLAGHPATIAEEWLIPFDKMRTQDLLSNERFIELALQLKQKLRSIELQ